ncbi:MAG TPA: sugar ABC transporter substrate-binding protein, partial [Firmicutes bacterium]|nr:sugar ABC transporter substrate-binding protein [Bacillota bacterium]
QTATTAIEFWTAPNPFQEAFWSEVVKEWNNTHHDQQIKWQVIPAGNSSEEVILTALATGTGPDLSTNIFTGFAAQLIENDFLVPFNRFDGFDELLKARSMENIVKNGWGFNGNYYVLPLYTNPMAYWWNKDVLDELGIDVPKTYSDVLNLGAKYNNPTKQKYTILTRHEPNWWDRWFDFCMSYQANSGGKPYWDDKKVLFNDAHGLKYMEFINQLFRKKYSPTENFQDALQKGIVLGSIEGPWGINYTKETYPEFNYVIAPPLVPDDYPADQPIHTFADTKGMVMLTKNKQKQEVAWNFIKWYYSDIKHDVKWLEKTNMLPSREDVLARKEFAEYLSANPQLAEYAKLLPYSVPPALNSKTIELQTKMNEVLWEPVIYGKKAPVKALNDAEKELNKIIKQ